MVSALLLEALKGARAISTAVASASRQYRSLRTIRCELPLDDSHLVSYNVTRQFNQFTASVRRSAEHATKRCRSYGFHILGSYNCNYRQHTGMGTLQQVRHYTRHSGAVHDEYGSMMEDVEPRHTYFRVKGHYIASNIRVADVGRAMPQACICLGKDFATFNLDAYQPELTQDQGGHHRDVLALQSLAQAAKPSFRHQMLSARNMMVVFNFGSVIFFTQRDLPAAFTEPRETSLAAASTPQAAQPSPQGAAASGPATTAAHDSAPDSSNPSSSSSSSSYGRADKAQDLRDLLGGDAQLDTVQLHTLRVVAGCSAGRLPSPRTEEALMEVRPDLEGWYSKEEPDVMTVSDLDHGNLEVIARVIGQSVALEHYNRQVDDNLQAFSSVLTQVAQPAKGASHLASRLLFSRQLRSRGLIAMLANSHMLQVEVITKLGLLDTSRTAWESDKHDHVWRSLRQEYELENRLDALKQKLGPMQDIAQFILEVRKDRRSALSEAAIIAIISAELYLALYEHHWLTWAMTPIRGLLQAG